MVVVLENMDDQSSVQSLTDYSLQVLDLCRILWGPIETPMNVQTINPTYFEEQKRRKMLSNWLHQCLLSQPQQHVTRRGCVVHLIALYARLAMGHAKL